MNCTFSFGAQFGDNVLTEPMVKQLRREMEKIPNNLEKVQNKKMEKGVQIAL